MEEDDALICYMCLKVEDFPNRLIECVQCNRVVHFRCKKIVGNAIEKTRRKPFFCSIDCSTMHAQNNCTENPGLTDVLNEIRRLSVSQQETQQQVATIVNITKQIEASQQFISDQFEQFKAELNFMKEDNEQIREDMDQWKMKHEALAERVDQMELEYDKLCRSTLNKNAVILGMPRVQNEDLKATIFKLFEVLGCQMGDDSISYAKRLGSEIISSAPILVTFNCKENKEKLFECKKLHGPLLVSTMFKDINAGTKKITIRDELTSYGRELLQEAKDFQTKMDIKYVWPGRDGKILLKQTDNSKPIIIATKHQLQELCNRNTKRSLNMSVESSGEPNAKRHQTAQ